MRQQMQSQSHEMEDKYARQSSVRKNITRREILIDTYCLGQNLPVCFLK